MRRNLKTVSTRCRRIAELANQSPQMGFTSLNHHIDLHWLHEAYLRTRKGNWVVKRKTAKSRLTRALRRVAQWCRMHRHQPITEQHRTLSPEAERALRVLRNHGQRFRVGHVPPRGDADLAQVAVPPTSTGWLPVATILSVAGALCAPTAGRGPLGVPSRSEPVT